jgi:hypothetical protein
MWKNAKGKKLEFQATVIVGFAFGALWQENCFVCGGNIGKSYYAQLKKSRKHKLVLWVDKNWEEISKSGFPVQSPEAIAKIEYNQIIVAVEDRHVAEEIKKELLKKV